MNEAGIVTSDWPGGSVTEYFARYMVCGHQDYFWGHYDGESAKEPSRGSCKGCGYKGADWIIIPKIFAEEDRGDRILQRERGRCYVLKCPRCGAATNVAIADITPAQQTKE